MDIESLTPSTAPHVLAEYLAELPRPPVEHHGPVRDVRRAGHGGHDIEIVTTYEITVDGRPLSTHIGLSLDGSAHCHGLPAYQFTSVVDLVRSLIEFFPEQFPTHTDGDDDGPGTTTDHTHGTSHPGEH